MIASRLNLSVIQFKVAQLASKTLKSAVKCAFKVSY